MISFEPRVGKAQTCQISGRFTVIIPNIYYSHVRGNKPYIYAIINFIVVFFFKVSIIIYIYIYNYERF